MKTTKLDLTGFTKSEVKELCNHNNYSLSTYYRSIKRGWIITKVDEH